MEEKETDFRKIISEEVQKAIKPLTQADAEYKAIRRANFAAASKYFYDDWRNQIASGEIGEYEDPYKPPEAVTRTFGRAFSQEEDDFRRNCNEVIGPEFAPQEFKPRQQHQPDLDWSQLPEDNRQRPKAQRFPQTRRKRNKSTPIAAKDPSFGARDGRDPSTWSFKDAKGAEENPAPPTTAQRRDVEEERMEEEVEYVDEQSYPREDEEEEEEEEENEPSVYWYNDDDDHDGYSD